MLYDNQLPRHLPHLYNPDILQMGLRPLDSSRWIEPDSDWLIYHNNKIAQRRSLGEKVYHMLPCAKEAARELALLLSQHLLTQHGELYSLERDRLHYLPEKTELAPAGGEPLWNCSLWIADDIVILQQADGEYRLTAASLAAPSEWLLEDKFGRPLADIHAPIPGFDAKLTPSVDRFFRHLKAAQPVERFNWSLQSESSLCQRPGAAQTIAPDSPLFYRTERQTLRRLPDTGAVVFTIRVYLHPLECLKEIPQALPALLRAIDSTAPQLAAYKRFDEYSPVLEKYRV